MFHATCSLDETCGFCSRRSTKVPLYSDGNFSFSGHNCTFCKDDGENAVVLTASFQRRSVNHAERAAMLPMCLQKDAHLCETECIEEARKMQQSIKQIKAEGLNFFHRMLPAFMQASIVPRALMQPQAQMQHMPDWVHPGRTIEQSALPVMSASTTR